MQADIGSLPGIAVNPIPRIGVNGKRFGATAAFVRRTIDGFFVA